MTLAARDKSAESEIECGFAKSGLRPETDSGLAKATCNSLGKGRFQRNSCLFHPSWHRRQNSKTHPEAQALAVHRLAEPALLHLAFRVLCQPTGLMNGRGSYVIAKRALAAASMLLKRGSSRIGSSSVSNSIQRKPSG